MKQNKEKGRKTSNKTILTIAICCLSTFAKAQLGYNYNQYEIGVVAGFNQVFGAAPTSPVSNSVGLNFTINQTPFVNYVFEAQIGTFKGGDSINTYSKRQFTSNFNSFAFRGQLQLGEIIEYGSDPFANAIKNIYISTGLGIEVSQITSIRRANTYGVGYSAGPNNNADAFIPFRLGYELKMYNSYNIPYMMIDLAGNFNLVLSNNLDGYLAHTNYDVFTQFSIGVKFALGSGSISYRKPITY